MANTEKTWQVESERLSDKSMAFNVIGHIDDRNVKIGCVSKQAAIELAVHLNDAAFIFTE